MRIVYVVARFHPYRGGSEQNCLQLAKRMVDSGHDVTVLTTSASPNGEKLPTEEEYLGFKIIRTRRWNNHLTLGFYPGMLPRLLKLEADVVHVENGPGYLWQNFCVLIKKLSSRKTKFINTSHDPFLATWKYSGFPKNFIDKLVKILLLPYLKFIWPRIWDIVIQVNSKQYQWLSGDYGVNIDKIRLLPNGIEEGMIISKKPAQKKPIGISFVGRVSWYKGVHKVIYALKELQTEKLGLEFIVMGKLYNPEIPALVQELGLRNVRFVDSPSDAERDRILTAESEINILPSQREATGIGLLEGMAKGNAIITTFQNESAEELIEQGVNGYIYDFDNTLDLADILRTLAQNEQLRQDMIKFNLAKVRQYTWESIFPEYLKILGEFDE